MIYIMFFGINFVKFL